MSKILLIVMMVTSDGAHDLMSERMESASACQAHGREFSESLLKNVPDVTRVSFKCVEDRP